MWLCVLLLYSVLQESSGCTVDRGSGDTITRSAGDSVELPCSCEIQKAVNPQKVQWGFKKKFIGGDYAADISVVSLDGSENQRYRGRVQRVTQNKPGTVALIISNLTEEDEGTYLCGNNSKYNRAVFLQVSTAAGHISFLLHVLLRVSESGCPLAVSYRRITRTTAAGKAGGAQFSDCSGCNVERGLGATITKSVGDSVVLPCSCTNLQDVPRKVKWGFTTNFTIGNYKAEEKVFPVDGSCTVLSFSERSFTRFLGESVLLPCPCPGEQKISDTVTWSFSRTETEDPTAVSNDTESYRGRVWMFDQNHSRNFSLLISDLTEEDSGYYECRVDGNYKPYVHLEVKGCTLSETQEKLIIRSPGQSVLLPCSCTDQHTKPFFLFLYVKVTAGKTDITDPSTEKSDITNQCDFPDLLLILCACASLLLIVVIGESALILKLRCNRTQGSVTTNIERTTQNTADNDYDNDPLGNQNNISMGPIYQSLDPNTNQSDSSFYSDPCGDIRRNQFNSNAVLEALSMYYIY
ncbi:hypothetical protein MHYP_G00088250 [Metynnis hypsauchen]